MVKPACHSFRAWQKLMKRRSGRGQYGLWVCVAHQINSQVSHLFFVQYSHFTRSFMGISSCLCFSFLASYVICRLHRGKRLFLTLSFLRLTTTLYLDEGWSYAWKWLSSQAMTGSLEIVWVYISWFEAYQPYWMPGAGPERTGFAAVNWVRPALLS